MANVILINPFEVPPGKEKEALDLWERGAVVMRKSPGYISTRLHRAVTPDARFMLINVAEWESVEHFQAVAESEEFKKAVAGGMEEVPHFPALYEVIQT